MNDLISRQAAVKALQDKVFHNLSDEFYGTMQVLDELPTVEAEPVRHGHWIVYKEDEESKEHIRCSVCGAYWSAPQHAKSFKRCYNCGAKMNLKEKNYDKNCNNL